MPGEQLKEIEDEEQTFQRKTTKLAMEMARSEAEKPMTKALTVESLVRQMQQKIEEMESSFSKEIDRSRSRSHSQVILIDDYTFVFTSRAKHQVNGAKKPQLSRRRHMHFACATATCTAILLRTQETSW